MCIFSLRKTIKLNIATASYTTVYDNIYRQLVHKWFLFQIYRMGNTCIPVADSF